MARKPQWIMPRDGRGRPVVDAYLRLSVGFEGREDVYRNQLSDIERIIEREKWTLGKVLSDGVSAYRRGVRRPGFEEMLERIENGSSAGVVFYNQDRLTRRMSDLERFLDLWEDGRSELCVAGQWGSVDLRDPSARTNMRLFAMMAMQEAESTSRRTRRKNQGKRDAGILVEGGTRAFGWDDGKVDRDILAREQEALCEAFTLLENGGTVQAVVDMWNGRGLVSSRGRRPWEKTSVRLAMCRQRHAGRIEHDGEVVGVIANYTPVIDPEQFDRVMAIFRSRRRGRPLSTAALGSGLLRCHCGATVRTRPKYTRTRGTVMTYFCVKQRGGCGHLSIDQEQVDALVRGAVIRALSNETTAQRVSSFVVTQQGRVADCERELASVKERRRTLLAKFSAGEIDEDEFSESLEIHGRRKRRLENELADLQAELADRQVVATHSANEVAHKWDQAWTAGDREVCRGLLREALTVIEITLLRGAPGGTIPVADRVEVKTRAG